MALKKGGKNQPAANAKAIIDRAKAKAKMEADMILRRARNIAAAKLSEARERARAREKHVKASAVLQAKRQARAIRERTKDGLKAKVKLTICKAKAKQRSRALEAARILRERTKVQATGRAQALMSAARVRAKERALGQAKAIRERARCQAKVIKARANDHASEVLQDARLRASLLHTPTPSSMTTESQTDINALVSARLTKRQEGAPVVYAQPMLWPLEAVQYSPHRNGKPFGARKRNMKPALARPDGSLINARAGITEPFRLTELAFPGRIAVAAQPEKATHEIKQSQDLATLAVGEVQSQGVQAPFMMQAVEQPKRPSFRRLAASAHL